MTGLLKTPKQHDRNKISDVERGRRRVKADIARHNRFRRESIKPSGIGELVKISAAFKQREQFGSILVHGGGALSTGDPHWVAGQQPNGSGQRFPVS